MSTVPNIIRRRYNKSKELSMEVFEKVEINKNLYKGIINADDTYEWDYSLVDPHVFPLVRNYLSRSNPAMSALRLDVRRPEDTEARQVNQDFVNWEIGEIMMTTLYYSAYLAGRGYCKTGWHYEPALKIQSKDADGNLIREKLLRDIVNRADAKFVRFNNLLIPDRNNPELQSQPFIIELIQQRVGDMLDENQSLEEKGEKPYWDKKFLKKVKESGVTGKLLEYEMERATDADSKDELAFKSATIPMMCMHTLDGEVFYMPLEGDDTILNNDTQNRYWHGHYPYIDFCPFPEDDEYFNLALVDIVGDLQIAATEVLNQTLTNIRQINNDMWVAGSSASQTPDWQFRKRPDGVIRLMGDVSQIQQIRTQDNTRPAILMAQELGSKIERAGGISSLYSSGAASQSINQTARGAQIIDQNIDTNMKMIVDLFGEQVLKKTGEHFLELNAQYVTEEQSFSVTGKRGVRELISLDPAKTTANFIVSVNTDKIQKQTPASRQASIQNSITVLQDIATRSQGSIEIDLVPAVEALIDATPEMESVGDIITTIDDKSKRDIAMLERGQLPEIKIRDAHEELVVAANTHFQQVETMPEEVQQVIEDYVNTHMRYLQSQAEVTAMKAQQQQQIMMASGMAGGGNNGMGGAPAGAPAPQQFEEPPENMGQQEGLPNPTYNLGGIV
jgi:hypothetical protein